MECIAFLTQSVPIPPSSIVRVCRDFNGAKGTPDPVTVFKGESVQILGFDAEHQLYFVRRLIYPHEDGWLPKSTFTELPKKSNSSWSFRFRKRSSFSSQLTKSPNTSVHQSSPNTSNNKHNGSSPQLLTVDQSNST